MNRIKLALVAALIVGMFAVIPGSAQSTGAMASANDTYSLPLLITINQMELSADQMQQIHDILAGIITEADGMSVDRDAFAAEMLTFTGSADDLNAKLNDFQTKMEDARAALQQSWQDAIDQIEGILTVKQGEILRNGLGTLGSGFLNAPSSRLNSPANAGGQSVQTPGSGWQAGQGQSDSQNAPMMAMRERMSGDTDRPARMAPQFGNQAAQANQCVSGGRLGPMQGGIGGPSLSQQTRGRGLNIVQQIVDILEAKLQ